MILWLKVSLGTQLGGWGWGGGYFAAQANKPYLPFVNGLYCSLCSCVCVCVYVCLCIQVHPQPSSWPLTTLLLTDTLTQSVPAHKHTSLGRLMGCPSTTVAQTKHVILLFLKITVKRFGTANQTVSSNLCGVDYFVRLSGQSYLSPGKRSVVSVL